MPDMVNNFAPVPSGCRARVVDIIDAPSPDVGIVYNVSLPSSPEIPGLGLGWGVWNIGIGTQFGNILYGIRIIFNNR